LLKQDKLSILEQETSLLFLGKCRSDKNPDRISLLAEIDTCLADYGIYQNGKTYIQILKSDRRFRQKDLSDAGSQPCATERYSQCGQKLLKLLKLL
jgi:hypothetical protein